MVAGGRAARLSDTVDAFVGSCGACTRVRLKLKWGGHFVRTLLILPLGAEPEAEDLDLVHCLVIELVWSIVPGRSEHGGGCGLVAVHSLLNMC